MFPSSSKYSDAGSSSANTFVFPLQTACKEEQYKMVLFKLCTYIHQQNVHMYFTDFYISYEGIVITDCVQFTYCHRKIKIFITKVGKFL